MSWIVDGAWVTPALRTALFMAMIAFLGVVFVPGNVKMTVRAARRVYWAGWGGATICGGMALLSRGPQGPLWMILMSTFLSVLHAYFTTPYIKIGGRVIALSKYHEMAQDSDVDHARAVSTQPDDYPGGITAVKQWWLIAAMVCFAALSISVIGWGWLPVALTAFLTLLGAGAGIGDASRDLPIARNQRVQGFVALAASAAMYGLPAIAYLCGYRWKQRQKRREADLLH